MSSNSRYFNTKFWRDNYVDSLGKIKKLFFIYLFTNPEATKCGIYEMPLRMIASDTDIEKDEVPVLFTKFEKDKKAFYRSGWVCTTSTIKHQATTNIKIRKGIENDLDNVPEEILKEFYELGDKRFKKILDSFHYKKDQEFKQEKNTQKTEREIVETPKEIVPDPKKETLRNDPVEPKKPKEKKLRNIIPPTLEMVEKYKKVRVAEGNKGAMKINPQGFIDYYETANWFRGKNKIKDWCSCFRTWESREHNSPQPTTNYNPRNSDALRRQKKEEAYRDELRERSKTTADNKRLLELKEQSKKLSKSKLA